MRNISLLNVVAISIVMVIGVNSTFAQSKISTQSVSTTQPLSTFDQELTGVETQFIEAWQAKNVAYAERTVASDFQGVALNGDLLERRELIDDVRDGMAKDLRTYGAQIVRLSDNCAVFSYSQILPGEHVRYRHVSDTWAKEAGEWKLKFEHRTRRVWSALDLD
jgi:hypothetical protein